MRALQLIFHKLKSLRLTFLLIVLIVFMTVKYQLGFTTPLVLAIEYGNIDIVRYMISMGFDVDGTNTNGEPKNPLNTALNLGDMEIMRLLLESGADPDTTDLWYERPLIMTMIEDQNIEFLKLLISKGADVNKTSNQGESPLHLATEKGDLDSVNLLLKAGAK